MEIYIIRLNINNYINMLFEFTNVNKLLSRFHNKKILYINGIHKSPSEYFGIDKYIQFKISSLSIYISIISILISLVYNIFSIIYSHKSLKISYDELLNNRNEKMKEQAIKVCAWVDSNSIKSSVILFNNSDYPIHDIYI